MDMSIPITRSEIYSGSHGDPLTDQLVRLIEYCWASGVTTAVCRARLHCDLHFIKRIYVRCDQRLISEANSSIKPTLTLA